MQTINSVHKFIDDLHAYAQEQSRKAKILELAMMEILERGYNSRDRNILLCYAADALAETRPGFEKMSRDEQNKIRMAFRR